MIRTAEPAEEIQFKRRKVLATEVCVCDYESSAEAILAWAQSRGSYATCHVNSHGVVNGVSDLKHQTAMNGCDLVTPDGSPIVKMLQKLGENVCDRVYGPDLMELVCKKAADAGIPIGLYGGRDEVLLALEAALKERYPALEIPYRYSPPFRPLSDEEKMAEDLAMSESGAKIFFIGLGCPKQEIYVYEKKLRGVPGVFMAVGAAIDINSGLQSKCPRWMQRHGLEWLFRLVKNPKRLWKRYATYPLAFLALSHKQLLTSRYRNT